MWYSNPPSIIYLKIWGYPTYVKLIKTDKMDVKFEKVQFIRYPKYYLGYYFYFLVNQRISINRNTHLSEKEFL